MRCLFIIILCITGNCLLGQELSHKQYTVKDGLPGSIVYHCLQDKNGFIWFATNQGVSRFDGRSFKNFSKEDGLPDNEILKLYLDKHNLVWCISLKGIPSVIYNGKIRQMDSCRGVIAIQEDLLSDSIFFTAMVVRGDTLFNGYYQSVNKAGDWQFTPHFRRVEDGVSVFHWPILKESSPQGLNFYYASSNFRVSEVTLKGKDGEKTCSIGNSKDGWDSPFNRYFYCTLYGDHKAFLFYTVNLLYYSDMQGTRSFLSLADLGLPAVRNGDVSSLFCENDSTLWICTRNRGLIRVRNFLQEKKTIQSFFPNSYCTSVIKDKEGCYWVTTHNDGVFYLPNLDFHYLSCQADLSAKDAMCIRNLGKGGLAAGFADGEVVTIDYKNLSTKLFPKWLEQKKNIRILDILPGKGNDLIVGGDRGAFILTPQDTWSRMGTLMAVKNLYIGPDAQMAMGTGAGVQLVNMRDNTQRGLSPFRSTCVTGIGGLYIWGTLDGVRESSGDSVRDIGKRYPELSGIINHIDIAPDSSLWVSTQEGVVILKNGHIYRVRKEDGLLGNTCKHILFDGGTVWISTDKGISRMDYTWKGGSLQYSLSGITEEDGLNSNDVNQTALGGNYIWVATARGICFFSKNFISHSFSRPVINIDRIVAGDQALLPADTVNLDYRKNKLLIELSGISFRSGRQINYEYRLNGLDSNWIRTTGNILEFSALPFGKFVFEVRAIDRWKEKTALPRRMVIINEPPFWKTGWFTVLTYVAMAFIIGLAFYFFNRQRHHKKEEEYRLKKKMNDLEMMALRTQMDPHFIFNCLSSIQYHIMQADTQNANLYLHKFSSLIRKILQRSSASVISLTEEIGMLELYVELEKMRLGDRLGYRINISEDLRYSDLYIPPMIIQPYVENAIRHGITPLQERKGLLNIGLSRSAGYIECTIEDNGIGIGRSRQNKNAMGSDHISMGTGNTESRIGVFNAIHENKILLAVTDKQGLDERITGTIVHLSFPIITN